jgi:hypothetical protein
MRGGDPRPGDANLDYRGRWQPCLFQLCTCGVDPSALLGLARCDRCLVRRQTFASRAAIVVREQGGVRLVRVRNERLARQVERVGFLELLVAVAGRLAEKPPNILHDLGVASVDRFVKPALVVARGVGIAGCVLDPSWLHLVDLPMQIAD